MLVRPTYQSAWVTQFQEQRVGYLTVASWDPFEDWELNTRPDGTAEDQLLYAVEIIAGRGEFELARQFLDRCLMIADRALRENTLQSARCLENAPENLGRLKRTQAYARAILGEPFDESAMLEASGVFEEACADYPRRKWDDFQEATYLEAIRLGLLSGSAATIQRLLQRRRSFSSHVEEHDLYRALAVASAVGRIVQDDAFRNRFDAFFDLVRNPNYDPVEYSPVPILRLEISLLRDKYLISSSGTIDWQRAINAMAE